MSTSTLIPDTGLPAAPPRPTRATDPARRLDWRRLRSVTSVLSLAALAIATVGTSVGTVAAGRMAEEPTAAMLAVLAACVVGGALLDTAGRIAWAGVVDRAEGRLRSDLLTAALHQPLPALGATAVGEILDRVDDDTRAVGFLVRQQLWGAGRTVFGVVPMWVVAGLTWGPAWAVFPVLAVVVYVVARPFLGEISRRKVIEEAAWTEHAAAFEEAVAARDDLRTSLGQSFAVRRLAELSAACHRLFERVLQSRRGCCAAAGCCSGRCSRPSP